MPHATMQKKKSPPPNTKSSHANNIFQKTVHHAVIPPHSMLSQSPLNTPIKGFEAQGYIYPGIPSA